MCVLNPWKTSLGFSSVNKGVLLNKCASPLPAPSLLLSLPVFAFYSQLTIISIISFFFFFNFYGLFFCLFLVSTFFVYIPPLFPFRLTTFSFYRSNTGSLSFLYLWSTFSNVRVWLLISLFKHRASFHGKTFISG